MQLQTMLAALPADRRDAIAAFFAEEVARCPNCEGPVTRTQPRELRKDIGVCHVDCDAHR